MKKILTFLALMTLGVSNSLVIVSCEKNPQPNNQTDETTQGRFAYYKLFDDYYLTPEDAISDVVEKEAQKTETSGFTNKILLGEDQFSSMDEMYQNIYATYKFNQMLTSRNPEENLINASGQLADNIVTDELKTIDVYEDVNQQAIYADTNDPNVSLKLAEDSYLNSIQKKYFADGEVWNSKDDLINHMRTIYQNQDDLVLQNFYMLGGMSVPEEQLTQRVAQRARVSYIYNGNEINEADFDDLSSFDLSFEDQSKIQTVHQTPGYFYLGKNSTSEGQLTASSIIESTADFASFVVDPSNWEETSSKSSSVFDTLLSSIVSVVPTVVAAVKDSESKTADELAMDDADLTNDFGILSIFKKYANQNYVDYFSELIKNYGLSSDLALLTSNLNTTDLMDSQKEDILMFKFSELLRTNNASNADIQKFREYTELAMQKRFSNEGGVDLVELFSSREILDIWKYLVDPGTFKQQSPSALVLSLTQVEQNIYSTVKAFSLDVPEKIINEVADATQTSIDDLTKTSNATKEITDKIETLNKKLLKFKNVLKVFGWIGFAISILDAIPLLETHSWQLTIPNEELSKEQKISYTVTNFWWDSVAFNPAELFSTFTITKPVAATRYLYNGSYFATRDDAERRAKLDVIDKLTKDGQAIYKINDFQSITASSLEDLTKKVVEQIKATAVQKYVDTLGNNYDSKLEAYNKMTEQLRNGDFAEVYVFDFDGKTYQTDSLAEAQQKLLSLLNLNKKTIYWTDLYQTTNFNELKDINAFLYNFVEVNINGKPYYFIDEWQAINFIMKQNNFQNIRIPYVSTTYSYRTMHFENLQKLEKYIIDNLEEIEGASEQEVYDHVVKK